MRWTTWMKSGSRLVWQEKRFPHSNMTLAFRATVPSTFVTKKGGNTIGVVVDASEFPFDPTPPPLELPLRRGRAQSARSGPAHDLRARARWHGLENESGEPYTFTLRPVIVPATPPGPLNTSPAISMASAITAPMRSALSTTPSNA
jgi:hypothetical protein